MIPQETIKAAQAAQRKWGVWASVSLAQFGVESAWGRAMPKGSNNPFGIKALPGHPSVPAVTREFTHGRYITIVARFAAFKDFDEAFEEHAKLLATHPHYYSRAMAHAWKSSAPSAEDFAKALNGVYATDPHYAETLCNIMRSMNLYQYDDLKDHPVEVL